MGFAFGSTHPTGLLTADPLVARYAGPIRLV